METNNPTIAVRAGEELDIDAVDRVLKAELGYVSGSPTVSQYASGASNLTYAFDYPGCRLVLRRPPFGTKPKSGHDMHREYRIMTALKPVFPFVPDTLLYSDDVSIIGAEFYVMDRVEGALIHAEIPAEWEWSTTHVRQLCENFWDKLIALHSVDYKAIGLEDFGRPDGYVSRQIGGWNARYEKALTDDADPFEDVRGWLADNQTDANGAAVLHGDYRIDNCILDTKDPTEIVCILDWEICAIGEPLMDLGAALAYWVEVDDDPVFQKFSMQPSMADGMMTRQEILTFYGERTGADVSDMRFYYVYGLFRLAGIFQQIYYRSYHGQTDNPRFKQFGGIAKMLGNRARHAIATGEI